ncbi:MAG: NTP transferase domain-containing protein [Anaerolineae bacterium]
MGKIRPFRPADAWRRDPRSGALGGLYAALTYCPTEYAVCVGCDMPFLNPQLLQYLIDQRGGYQAVAPSVDGQIEALHAIYSRSCLSKIRQQIDARQLRLSDLYSRITPGSSMPPSCAASTPTCGSFVNLNTDSLSHAQHDRQASPPE